MTEVEKETPGATNRVTIIIYDQEVTIEGRQSKQELLTLGKSLAP